MAGDFAAEADMLALIAAAAPALAGSEAFAVFEVQAAAGVPDVVVAILDRSAVAEREQAGFITNQAALSALLALSDALDADQALDTRQVATAAGITPRYAASSVLPALAERGLVVNPARNLWQASKPYRSPALRLVTFEAKLRDWRRGLGQAARHAAGADAAWLVLDGSFTHPAEKREGWFRTAGVGLAALNRDGALVPLLPPIGASVLRVRRELLAERTASLRCAGLASGSFGHVFGRNLAPTTGADPRLAGAGAH